VKREKIQETNKFPHFIGCWHIEPLSLCEEVISFFENNYSKHKTGRSGEGPKSSENKKSTDITVNPIDLRLSSHYSIKKYMDALHSCYKDYLSLWPFLKGIMPQADIGSFNIQRYLSGGHFKGIHTERTSIHTLHRVLVWMTYLNTVDEGGETFFPHYQLRIKPEKGKTLIWPADWTHAHSGEVVRAGSKYIITGWMHYPV